VRELTERIDAGLRRVTINLERWEDRPLVEFVEEIWSTQAPTDRNPAEKTARIERITTTLSRLRQIPDSRWSGLVRRVADHQRRLHRLGLKPRDLGSRTDLSTSLRWTWRRLYLVFPPSIAVAAVEHVLFWVPYRLTALAVRFAPREEEARATYKLLLGALLYGLWILLAAGLIWRFAGWWWALSTLVVLPILGAVGRRIRERWRWAWDDVRRFFLVRTQRDLVVRLRQEQEQIFEEIAALDDAWRRGLFGDP
jgi:hypothetical protein